MKKQKQFKEHTPRKLKGEIALFDPFATLGFKKTRYNPSVLISRKGYQIIDEMIKDDQIKAALNFKKHSVLSAGWQVTSPNDAPKDWEVTEFVQSVLKNMVGTFDNDIKEILSAIEYGFSISEKIFDYDKSGKIVLKEIKTKMPHHMEFYQDDYGNLEQIYQNQKLIDPIDKFVIYTYNKRFGNIYGSSDLESAYRPWFVKENSYKWFAVYLERMGIPPIFALYENGSFADNEILELQKILDKLQSATVGALPRTGKDGLELWSPTSSSTAKDNFIPAIMQFNNDIARSMLTPGQIGASQDDSVGSYAKSKTQFDLYMTHINHIKKEVAETVINEQIIKQLVDFNFITDGQYPRFEFLEPKEETKYEMLTAWKDLVGLGVVNNQEEDEDHIRKLFKFPEKSEETRIQINQPEPSSTDGKKFSELRSMTEQEQADLALETFNEIEEETKARSISALEVTRDKLLDYIAKSFKDGGTNFVSGLKLKNIGELSDIFGDMLLAGYNSGRTSISAALKKKKYLEIISSAEVLKWLKEKKINITGVLSDKVLAKVKQILLNAIKTGETLDETILKTQSVFEDYLGSKIIEEAGELLNPWRIETIIRTNLTEAYNMGRLKEMQEPGVIELISAIRYSAILDDRTTSVCKCLNGKYFNPRDPDIKVFSPPNHFNCRSILVPVTFLEKVDKSKFITLSGKGQCKSLAGQGFV